MSQSSNGPGESQVVLTCVYCGHAYPPGTPAAMHPLLTAHIAQCPAHPMRAVVEQRDALLRACEQLFSVALPPHDVSGRLMWDEAHATYTRCFQAKEKGNP